MRVLVQRVRGASCTVDGVITGQIEQGFLLLVGFTEGDNLEKLDKAAKKVANLRVFEDEDGKMNLNVLQVGGSILSISQFTLYANTSGGNRPSFIESMNPSQAERLYLEFNKKLSAFSLDVQEGIFGSHMDIRLLNDGPVTILLEF